MSFSDTYTLTFKGGSKMNLIQIIIYIMKRDVLSEIRSDSDKLVFLVLAMTYIVRFVRMLYDVERKI